MAKGQRAARFKDLSGKTFNKWTVIGGVKIIKTPSGQSKTYWECKCECGKVKDVYSASLISGKSHSCGCIKYKLPKGIAARNRVFAEYTNKCRREKLEFSISHDYFYNLISKNCFYCDIKPSNVIYKDSKYGEYYYNGIDRIDNTRGYSEDNIVTSCKNCNLAKRSLSKEEFFSMIKKIYERHLK